MDDKALARFDAKFVVNETTGCWDWTASKNAGGYGTFWKDGGSRKAHRVAYEYHVGKIPDDLQIDHLCRNRICCNPSHLEPVTLQENIRRGEAGENQSGKTHCPQGHPYSGDNLYTSPSKTRECRICQRAFGKLRYAKSAGTRGHPNADKTHCKHGHELSGENLYMRSRGGRECRTCRRNSKQRWAKKHTATK